MEEAQAKFDISVRGEGANVHKETAQTKLAGQLLCCIMVDLACSYPNWSHS